MDDSSAGMASATWGKDVLEALRKYFDSGRLIDPVELVEATLSVTNDGSPAVIAIYDHPWYDRRVGLRFGGGSSRKLNNIMVFGGTCDSAVKG